MRFENETGTGAGARCGRWVAIHPAAPISAHVNNAAKSRFNETSGRRSQSVAAISENTVNVL
jgi:hypothetical protein